MISEDRRYTEEELKEYIDKVIMFEVEVDNSSTGESKQHPVFLVKEIKPCANGNVVIVGCNLIRLSDSKYNMADPKAMPYRAYSINKITYGSIKHIID